MGGLGNAARFNGIAGRFDETVSHVSEITWAHTHVRFAKEFDKNYVKMPLFTMCVNESSKGKMNADKLTTHRASCA